VTGYLVNPPSLVVGLAFDSVVQPRSLESVYRGSHAFLDLGFSTPPEIGETVFPVYFRTGSGRGGTDYRFIFHTAEVERLTVTGSMEAGPECRASLQPDGLPDTSTSAAEDPRTSSPPPLVPLGAPLLGALAWRRRQLRVR